MKLDVWKVKVNAFAWHTVTCRIRIQIAERLELRSVIAIVCERYRGKYKEECEREA